MDATFAYWAVGFPLFLILVMTGIATVAVLSDSQSVGFAIARICFILATVTFIAFSVYWLYVAGLPLRITVILSAGIGLSIPALMASLYWVQHTENILSTKLFPADLPSPPLPPNVSIPDGALRVYLGTSIAWATFTPFNVITVANEPLIQINRDNKNNTITITIIKIFDDRNDIIATVDPDVGIWVRNINRSARPDISTLVVFDHDGHEALRISMLNKTAIMVTGIFNDRRLQTPIIVDKDFIEINTIKIVSSSFGNFGTAIRVGGAGKQNVNTP